MGTACEPRRDRHRGNGQAIAEFALLLPILLVLTVGIVDLARIFAAHMSLTNAVREGAMYASMVGYDKWCSTSGPIPCPAGTASANKDVNPDNVAYRMSTEAAGLTAADVVMAAPLCTTTAGADFSTAVLCTTEDPAFTHVQISATYDLPLFMPLLSDLLGGSIHLHATTAAYVTAD